VNRDICYKILETIRETPNGLTTSEIASKIGANRMTVSKYLELLRVQGFVEYRQIGSAKVWFSSKMYSETIRIIRELEKPYIQKQILENSVKPVREKLGDEIPLQVFKLARLGSVLMAGADDVMFTVGREISKEVLSELVDGENVIQICDDLAEILEKLKVGILELISHNSDRVVVHLYECMTCSGMPNIGRPICHFEGGLIGGTFEVKLRRKLEVMETKCWGTGYKFCEFEIRLQARES
jgi:predicted hydrocarbon binding protein